MPQGKVKWFSNQKGYGFISSDDGKDYFVHYDGIKGDGFKTLPEGADVQFEIQEHERGPRAINVTLV